MKEKQCKNCSGKKTVRTKEEKKIVTDRLNRIEGQIKGIKRMIEEDRYCSDVLMQLSAVENSIKSLSNHVLENHLYTCVANDLEAGKVEIVDEHTIRIELNKEIPFFEYNLIFPIISSKQYEEQDLEKSTQIPVGTGKYQITKITEDNIELTRNNNYRESNLNNQNMKTIEIFLYDTMGEVYNEFKLGNIDFFHTANHNIEEYIGTMGYGKKVYGNREYHYLAMNCQDTIVQYQEVRKAISLSINQEKIVASVLEDQAIASYFPLDAKSYLLSEITIKQESNTEKAKETLENAGWSYEYGIWQKEIEGRTRTLNITLSVQKSDETRVKVAEEIKKELENVGIKVSIEQISDTQYQKYLANHQYEILLTGVNTSLSPDLSGFLGEGNLANYENEEIKQILQELNNITEENLQKEKYKRILEIYQEEVPYIGLYCNQDIVAYSANLMGEVQPNNYSIYYHLEEWYRQ